MAFADNHRRNPTANRDLRAEIDAESTPITDATPGVEAVTRRLAQQVVVPGPAVRLTEPDRPESLTVGSCEEALVIVSRGLLDVLSEEELQAVLANEISHLANGDGRVGREWCADAGAAELTESPAGLASALR